MMHTRSTRGPSGEIELRFEHAESGGEHRDTYETITLKAAGEQLLLIEATRSTTVYNQSESTREDRYEIAPELLIELIKKHGKRK